VTPSTATLTVADPPALLDVLAVARLLDCSSRHVYRLSDAGRMPRPVRIGALARWPRQAIERWIAAGCPAEGGRRRG
jgi:excisionase family DNA binding protein